MELQVMGGKTIQPDIFTYDFISILCLRVCAIVHWCKLRSLSCDLPILRKRQQSQPVQSLFNHRFITELLTLNPPQQKANLSHQ